jgi:hypothetical protein
MVEQAGKLTLTARAFQNDQLAPFYERRGGTSTFWTVRARLQDHSLPLEEAITPYTVAFLVELIQGKPALSFRRLAISRRYASSAPRTM